MLWTTELIARARALWLLGDSASVIGDAMGVSKNAIIGVAHREHFPARAQGHTRNRPRTEPKPKPPPLPPVVRLEAPPALPASRLRSEGGCCWPVGEPRSPGFGYCGRQAERGRAYCAAHRAVARRPRLEAEAVHVG